ncbi:DUF4962 domain-containing protein [Clostridium grantii]|uniref:Heparinase II/III-like protein n=1 Tax=Clostridium grantii DSM 8605 TaxID=1121316 RepID=A0A1M5UVN7_9CLOT|nr:DUF4962 domain-containing protein [Clostridium grantii]SHH67062.1 Heparinase II/III-like protein [Clostridium grantii DSM 8605]
MNEKKYLFISQDIDVLREEIKNVRKPFFKRLYDMCRLYSTEQLPEVHPPKSTTFMGIASVNLSLAYLLTKQKHYLEEAKRWIFTAVNYPHWGNAHLVDVDLSASWLLFGLSLSYDWLKDGLSEEEKVLFKEKLILQAERMYEFKINTEGEGWSTAYWQNHNWINLNGLATAGYALKEEYENAQLWIDNAKENFEIVYNGMADDGSDYEGVVYWRYGAMWLFVYAHLLKDTENIDYFKSCGFLKNTFYYRLYQAAPNLEEIINFGDCHDRRSGHSSAVYYKVASEYGNEHAQFLANDVRNNYLFREQYESGVKPGILPEAALELLWFNPEVQEKNFEDLPLVKHFEDLGLVVVRSSWEKDAIHFSFKSGHPGGKKQWKQSWDMFREKGWKTRGLSHQHPDNNSFILHAFDAYLAVDEGYNRTVKASEHNVVTIDGKGYTNEGGNNIWKETPKDVVAEIETFKSEKGITYFVGEAHKMYDPSLQLTRFARNVIYTEKGYFIILDELMSDLEHTYTWNMHSDTFPNKIKDNVFEYENGPAKMRLYSIESDECSYNFKNTNVRAVMTTQEPDKFRETRMKTMVIENKVKSKDTYFLNILSTRSAFDDEGRKVKEINVDGARGFVIEDNSEKEIFLFSKSGKIEFEDIKVHAKIVLLQYKNEKLIKVMASDCTQFTCGEIKIFENSYPLTIIQEV